MRGFSMCLHPNSHEGKIKKASGSRFIRKIAFIREKCVSE